jgi:hypothetical protein
MYSWQKTAGSSDDVPAQSFACTARTSRLGDPTPGRAPGRQRRSLFRFPRRLSAPWRPGCAAQSPANETGVSDPAVRVLARLPPSVCHSAADARGTSARRHTGGRHHGVFGSTRFEPCRLGGFRDDGLHGHPRRWCGPGARIGVVLGFRRRTHDRRRGRGYDRAAQSGARLKSGQVLSAGVGRRDDGSCAAEGIRTWCRYANGSPSIRVARFFRK